MCPKSITIPLNSKKYPGLVAVIDEADYELVSQFKWHPRKSGDGRIYAHSTRAGQMHYLITGYEMTDHIDGDGLNNRRSNLRPVNHAQNQMNRRPQGGSSRYKGVHWFKPQKKWVARIVLNGRKVHLGYFTDEVEAAKAYDAAAVKHFGDYARPNFPITPGLNEGT